MVVEVKLFFGRGGRWGWGCGGDESEIVRREEVRPDGVGVGSRSKSGGDACGAASVVGTG